MPGASPPESPMMQTRRQRRRPQRTTAADTGRGRSGRTTATRIDNHVCKYTLHRNIRSSRTGRTSAADNGNCCCQYCISSQGLRRRRLRTPSSPRRSRTGRTSAACGFSRGCCCFVLVLVLRRQRNGLAQRRKRLCRDRRSVRARPRLRTCFWRGHPPGRCAGRTSTAARRPGRRPG